jgi:hypothetical protein
MLDSQGFTPFGGVGTGSAPGLRQRARRKEDVMGTAVNLIEESRAEEWPGPPDIQIKASSAQASPESFTLDPSRKTIWWKFEGTSPEIEFTDSSPFVLSACPSDPHWILGTRKSGVTGTFTYTAKMIVNGQLVQVQGEVQV